jgi:hypothetical protein
MFSTILVTAANGKERFFRLVSSKPELLHLWDSIVIIGIRSHQAIPHSFNGSSRQIQTLSYVLCVVRPFFYFLKPPTQSFLTAMYQKNQAVEAYYDDGWYGGIIHKLNDDGTFVVHFDDGDVADDIRLDEIRLPQNGTEGNNGFEEDDDDDPFGDEIKPQRKTIVSSILLTCP